MGKTTNAVVPKPITIPCSKNPNAFPSGCPVGGRAFTAFFFNSSALGKAAGGVTNCGRGTENISDVYLGCREWASDSGVAGPTFAFIRMRIWGVGKDEPKS